MDDKSAATTCCGSGINEIGAINKYKYGPNNNKSGATCCCGCVSIETGTNVAAIVLCVLYIGLALHEFFSNIWNNTIGYGLAYIVLACISLLVIFAQQARIPWLFLPCLILGFVELIFRMFYCLFLLLCATQKEPAETLAKMYGVDANYLRTSCLAELIGLAVSIALFAWLYSIILRGFSAAREVESRRYRPLF